MKNVLITGSSGFIGYHLSLLYLKKGFCVFGIDNHSDGYDVKLKQWRNIECSTILLNTVGFKIYW